MAQGSPPGGIPPAPVPVETASKKKKTKPKTPEQQARRNVRVASATQALTDPFVGIDRHGRLVAVKNPAHAVKVFGQPLTRSQFLREQAQLNDLYLTFTGKKSTPKQVAHILTSGMSTYQVKVQLSKTKGFIGSPVWRQNAPGYQSIWADIYGPESKPDEKEIRYAIVNNLQNGFAQRLRQRTDYVTSNEFKGNEATLSAVYSRIYGLPGANGEAVVKTAVLNGWNQDQFASYLRAQPQYTNSEEFQTKALSLASALGMVTGSQPTMQAGFGGSNVNPNTQGKLKPDPRVMPGAVAPTTGLTVSGGQKQTGIAGVVQ